MKKSGYAVLIALFFVTLFPRPASAAHTCAGKDLRGKFAISDGKTTIRKGHVEELKLDRDPLDHGIFLSVKLDPRGTAQLKRITRANLSKEIQIQIGDAKFSEFISGVIASGTMQLKPPVTDPAMPPAKLSRAMFDQVCPSAKPTH